MARFFVEYRSLLTNELRGISSDRLPEIIDGSPYLELFIFVNQPTRVLAERFLRRSHYRLSLVSSLDELPLQNVLFGELKRVQQHFLNLIIGQSVRRFDFD